MCPDWESIERPFGSQASTQSTEPHQRGLKVIFKVYRCLSGVENDDASSGNLEFIHSPGGVLNKLSPFNMIHQLIRLLRQKQNKYLREWSGAF